MASIDRAELLRDQDPVLFTGIDFVRIEEPCDQTVIRIYLVNDARDLEVQFFAPSDGPGGDEHRPLTPESFVIESDTDPSLPRLRVLFVNTENHDATETSLGTGSQVQFDASVSRVFIQITVAEPGNFGRYRLHIDDPEADPDPTLEPFSRIDRFFNDKIFSFKVGCADDLDCAPPVHECPVEPPVDFAVDYLARDFVSFRNALIDFAAQRYPFWTLPNEADVGMMLAEVMAALGDEFSYIQDRHAREAFLETATQRRSLRKKARLIDFEIHDGRSASTFLDLTIDGPSANAPLDVRSGSLVFALSESGDRIPFEIGLGLRDRTPPDSMTRTLYRVREVWNLGTLKPYIFDDSSACLPVGATEIFLDQVPGKEDLLTDETTGERPRRMLLRTEPTDLSVPARRHLVRIRDATDIVDPLALGGPKTLTRIRWDEEDALPFELDQNVLVVSLNIVPATAGETIEERFVSRATQALDEDQTPSVDREGALKLPSRERETITLEGETNERPVTVLMGIQRTETDGLGFLGENLRDSIPEIEVQEDVTDGNLWTWVRTLIDAPPLSEVFTLEDGVWRRIRGFRRIGQEIVHRDYATGAGFSVRFGDNEFGQTPSENQKFRVRYRTGPGSRANVSAGTINALDTDHTFSDQTFVTAATNPLAVSDGTDPETATEIRMLAPEAYQAEVLFAVRAKDYGQQAQRFSFVQRAQGTPRWTGSWQTMFVAADPFGASNLTFDQRDTLEAWMDCVRQAGRDVIVRDPKTVPIDLEIEICLEPNAYAAHVIPQVEELLLGRGLGNQPKGFFHPDNFTFGTPLRRSALEAVIQSVPGVQSVRRMFIRLRGVRRFRLLSELTLKVGRDQILRLDNDPTRPEAGTLRLFTEGGA